MQRSYLKPTILLHLLVICVIINLLKLKKHGKNSNLFRCTPLQPERKE